MRSTLSQYAFLFLYSSMATAQETRNLILPDSGSDTFPACAVGCTVLQSAQTGCQPSADTQLNFENCFCQASTLAGLYTTPDAVCVAECPDPGDRQLLQSWYGQFCQLVGQGVDPLTVAAPQPTTTMVTVTSTSASTPSPTITGTGINQSASTDQEGSWISNHWQWVLMVGILAIGFGLIAWGAVWWKRRHQRKKDQRRAAASGFPTETEKRRSGVRSATPELWGPHQHMHATKGWEYSEPQISTVPSSRDGYDRSEYNRSRQNVGPRERALRDSAMSEVRPASSTSRKKSMKGKSRNVDEIQQHDDSRHGSRSRSHRRRDRGDG